MTRELSLRSLDIPSIHRFGIGFDSMLDELLRATSQTQSNYPPHNVIKTGDETVLIEVAVAGFNEGEVSVEVRDGDLIVSGEKLEEEAVETNEHYHVIHKGISARKFLKSWQMGEYVEVVDATVVNGILTVSLERKVPESAKPKSIAIAYKK